jgi:hypothetical protein
MTKKNNYYIKTISSILIIITFIIISIGSGNSEENNSVSPQNSPSSSSVDNSDSSGKTLEYDRNTVYEAGKEDFTNCLNGGIIPTHIEERAMFKTRFPNGTEKDYYNYADGCNSAAISNMSLIQEIKNN